MIVVLIAVLVVFMLLIVFLLMERQNRRRHNGGPDVVVVEERDRWGPFPSWGPYWFHDRPRSFPRSHSGGFPRPLYGPHRQH